MPVKMSTAGFSNYRKPEGRLGTEEDYGSEIGEKKKAKKGKKGKAKAKEKEKVKEPTAAEIR